MPHQFIIASTMKIFKQNTKIQFNFKNIVIIIHFETFATENTELLN